MKTKAQLARQEYSCSLDELSSGNKAHITRLYNAQHEDTDTPAPRTATPSGYLVVKFGRPGINGTKESVVKSGTNIEDALSQSGFTINASKEGIIKKSDGNTVKFADVAEETTYFIVPGVDSSE